MKIDYKNIPLYGESKTEIHGLVELEGSDKQIKWAEDIRKSVIINSYRNFKEFKAGVQKFYKLEDSDNKIKFIEKDFLKQAEKRYSNKSAKWWIDNRDIRPMDRNFFVEDSGWRKIFKEDGGKDEN